MSFQLYLRPHPRTLILVSHTNALVFKPHARGQYQNEDGSSSRTDGRNLAIVEFLPLDQLDLEGTVKINKSRGVGGVLGLLNIPIGMNPSWHSRLVDPSQLILTFIVLTVLNSWHFLRIVESTKSSEIFLLCVAAATPLPPILPSTCLTPSKVLSVEFHCLSSSLWDDPNIVPSHLYQSESDANQDGYDEGEGEGEDDGFTYSDRQLINGYYEATRNTSSTSLPNPSTPNSSSPGLTLAQQQGIYAHPCDGIKKYIETGTFYFATNGNWDLSKRMAEWDWKGMIEIEQNRWSPRGETEVEQDLVEMEMDGDKAQSLSRCLENFEERFVWNSNILHPLLHFRKNLSPGQRRHFDTERMLVVLIQGFVNVVNLGSRPLPPPGSSGLGGLGGSGGTSLSLISRLSWKRAGARFKTRGVDDEGNVANFVETETILVADNKCMSYVQVRGSVPLFWEQTGTQTFGQKLKITRPQAASQPAFDKHFGDLISKYHGVHAINLLGGGENEKQLSEAYNKHLRSLVKTLKDDPDVEGSVELTPYDFHTAIRIAGHEVVRRDFGSRLGSVVTDREKFGYTVIDRVSGEMLEEQSGVFRVNCMDCLDRTNYVEDVLSSLTIASFLTSLKDTDRPIPPSLFNSAHRELWADNGDALSKIYAGTGALNTSVTRSGKKSLASLFSDASKSVGRAIQATFGDQEKQASIELFLGVFAGQIPVKAYDPVADGISAEMSARIDEYSRPRNLRIYNGTWNLNGRALTAEVEEWLFPPGVPDGDIYAIGFQELVPLNAQQILQTDPAPRRRCETALTKMFAGRSQEYLVLRSEQLVGTTIFVIAQSSLLPFIRNVEGTSKKTGLRGMSGNKGGCAIRLDVWQTSMCFVTSHLAAGHSNVVERNADFHTISSGISFQRGRGIDDHDFVFWCGDFNYRINMSNEDARAAAMMEDLQDLWVNDQLRIAMMEKNAFGDYTEGVITFKPTYKYDIGTDRYDTSEKQRIPAWTDRVLYKGNHELELDRYSRAEIRSSDHRPVYATFNVIAHVVDEEKRKKLLSELAKKAGRDVNHSGVSGEIAADELMKSRPTLQTSRRSTSNIVPTADLVALRRGDSAAPLPLPARDDPSKYTFSPKRERTASSSTSSSLMEDDFVKIRHNLGVRRIPPAIPTLSDGKHSSGQPSEQSQPPRLPKRSGTLPTSSSTSSSTVLTPSPHPLASSKSLSRPVSRSSSRSSLALDPISRGRPRSGSTQLISSSSTGSSSGGQPKLPPRPGSISGSSDNASGDRASTLLVPPSLPVRILTAPISEKKPEGTPQASTTSHRPPPPVPAKKAKSPGASRSSSPSPSPSPFPIAPTPLHAQQQVQAFSSIRSDGGFDDRSWTSSSVPSSISSPVVPRENLASVSTTTTKLSVIEPTATTATTSVAATGAAAESETNGLVKNRIKALSAQFENADLNQKDVSSTSKSTQKPTLKDWLKPYDMKEETTLQSEVATTPPVIQIQSTTVENGFTGSHGAADESGGGIGVTETVKPVSAKSTPKSKPPVPMKPKTLVASP